MQFFQVENFVCLLQRAFPKYVANVIERISRTLQDRGLCSPRSLDVKLSAEETASPVFIKTNISEILAIQAQSNEHPRPAVTLEQHRRGRLALQISPEQAYARGQYSSL